MLVLMGNLMIGLGMLIAQVLMQLGMLVRAQALLVRVPVGLVELIVDVGVLLVELLMLSAMSIRGVGEHRKRHGECHRTDRHQCQIAHVESPDRR